MIRTCSEVFQYDQMARTEFGSNLCGIDEAGRGPLAGPVVAAAVVLPDRLQSAWIYDSKQLKPQERQEAYKLIIEQALGYGIGVIDHEYIDQYNVLQATYEAMRMALNQVVSQGTTIDMVMVDGAIIPHVQYSQRKVIHGDRLSQSIGAASILAKVTRDRIMLDYAQIYPEYGFERHMGYGTPEHLLALDRFKPSPIHRLTFAPVKAAMKVKDVYVESDDRRMTAGRYAEGLAVSELESKGYELLERNWRTNFGEIDAIMRDGDTLVFIEVRSRTGLDSDHNFSLAGESIHVLKRAKVKRLASAYLQHVFRVTDVRFDVVVVSFTRGCGNYRTEHYMDAF